MSSGDSSATAKAELRREARQRRLSLGAETRARHSESICGHILSLVAKLREPSTPFTVTGFVSIQSEVAVDSAMRRLLDEGVIVGIPRVIDFSAGIMEMDQLDSAEDLDRLVPGPHDILQRAEAKCLDVATIDVVFVPLLAFDKHGTRLGAGAGYYDRFLAKTRAIAQQTKGREAPKFIGVGFSLQEFDSLPAQQHDIGLDGIITEQGLRRF